MDCSDPAAAGCWARGAPGGEQQLPAGSKKETQIEKLKRILLVDDEPKDVALTMLALNENQVENKVDVVCDGAEALDYLFRRGVFESRYSAQPAVILLDLGLPDIDGLEVLEQIRSNPVLKMIPVVMLASSPDECERMQSQPHEVTACVVKSVPLQSLIQAIGALDIFK